ncbi:MAG: iron ABC transporter permease [Oscillospiraceae bacterium]|nr:iron ABC transporter permease [Oscillospiraceae bacterium]
MKQADKRKLPYPLLMIILAGILFALMFVAFFLGQYQLSPTQVVNILLSRIFPIEPTWGPVAEVILFQIRLPRIAAAILIGAALATAGATYQGIFRNPMVSPDFLGVSSGASIGAALAIILNLSFNMVQLFAFVFGIVAVLITTSIPKMLRNSSTTILILSGIVVSGIFSSIMSIIRYVADPDTALPAIVFWQMGSLSGVRYGEVMAVSLPMIISLIALIGISWWINVMSLGETQSALVGVDFKLYRCIAIVASTMLAVLSVAIAGTIGWVGIAMPHLSRMLVGVDNRKLIPACCLTGAIFMLIVDTVARNLTRAEIPLGVLTGLIGAPFFIALIYKQRARIE